MLSYKLVSFGGEVQPIGEVGGEVLGGSTGRTVAL